MAFSPLTTDPELPANYFLGVAFRVLFQEFDSRNKMFQHVKAENHSIPLERPIDEPKKKSKGRRRRK